jgi:hypothetical protein
MLAIAGYVNAEIFRWPGEIAPGLKFADVPNGLRALDAIPSLGWLQIFFLIGAVDYYGFFQYPEVGIPDLDPAEMERRKNSELTYVQCRIVDHLVQPGVWFRANGVVFSFYFATQARPLGNVGYPRVGSSRRAQHRQPRNGWWIHGIDHWIPFSVQRCFVG